MNQKQIFTALGALTLALAGCGGSQINDDGSGGSGTTAGTGPNGAGGSTGVTPGQGGTPGAGAPPVAGTSSTAGAGNPGGGASSSGGATSGPSTCVKGIPTTTQIPRMLNRQYDAVVRDLLGVTTVGTDAKAPSQMLFGDFTGNMTPDAWRLYQDVANQIAHDVMNGPNKSKFISCDPAATGCMDTTIKTFGRKAFRRALTDAEVARFQKLGQTTPKGTPAEVAETTLAAFLQSPSFILIPELNTTADPTTGAIALSSQEVAARLSFLLWGSIPDDALNTAADNNMLTTKDQILAQAQRMLMVREKAAPFVTAFHRDWVQMNNSVQHWWKVNHDPAAYTLWNSTTSKASLSAEMDKFFEEVSFTGSFKDLFLSPVAFVNKDNAAIYGLDASKYGTDLQKTTLDATNRPGFLTRAGFLSSYAHNDGTAPILRGAFIMVYLIGINPGPPVDGATSKTAPPGDYKTNREYTDALVGQDASCKTCHVSIINPTGYTLENFDAIGAWQTRDPMSAKNTDMSVGQINSTATVMFSATDSRQVTNPQQLMQGIADQLKAKQMYASAWVSYAYGRPMNNNDQCIVDQLGTKLAGDGYSVVNLLADLTQADSFRLRVRATP